MVNVSPIIIPILIFLIPIIAILTAHQRKMAELIHGKENSQQNPEVAALRHEVYELKQLIHQQAIAIDNLTSQNVRSMPPNDIQQRISG